MTTDQQQVIEAASRWAQAASDLASAEKDLHDTEVSDDPRPRMVNVALHRCASAAFADAEVELMDAVRASWSK